MGSPVIKTCVAGDLQQPCGGLGPRSVTSRPLPRLQEYVLGEIFSRVPVHVTQKTVDELHDGAVVTIHQTSKRLAIASPGRQQ